MADLDSGVLAVREGDHLVGVITDRDIAIRGIAQGRGPDAKVSDVMTSDIKYCFDDQDVAEVSSNIADIQLRRHPVVNRDNRLVGILSLCDIVTTMRERERKR